jgi:hypothetical protein
MFIVSPFCIKLSPCGPIKTPARINPIMLGTLSLLSSIGERSTINKSNAKTSTGFVKGT